MNTQSENYKTFRWWDAHGAELAADQARRQGMINIIVALIVVGVLLWLVNSLIPMDAKIRQILNVVAVIAVVLWLLQAFGLLH